MTKEISNKKENTVVNNKIPIACSSLGLLIEWYDFGLYLIMAPYLQVLFFPSYRKSTAFLLFTIIFVLAYLARMIGGSLLASFSDRFGRKKVFVLSAMLMTTSAIIMAIFPVHYIHGTSLVLSLVLLRIMQGISVGSEAPGAYVLTYEHAKKKNKMLSVGITYAFGSIGCLIASLVCLVLSDMYSYQQILNYAWRIPYVIAGISGIMLFIMRRKISETPEFNQIGPSSKRRPFSSAMKSHGYILCLITGAGLAYTTMSSVKFIQNIYLPDYFHYTLHQIFWMNIILYAFQFTMTFIAILLINVLKIDRILYLSFWVNIIIVCPSYWLLPKGGYGPMLLWVFSSDFMYTLCYLAITKYLLANTKVEVRTSVITIFSNVGTLVGALFPLMITVFLNRTGDPYVVPKIGWLVGVVSYIFMIVFIRHTNKVASQVNSNLPVIGVSLQKRPT